MAASGKERQRRWKEKQKDKKQVTVMLSKEAYDGLKRVKENTHCNFSAIIENAILDHSHPLNIDITKHHQTADKPSKHRGRIEGLIKAFTKELTATNEQLRQEVAGRINAERLLNEGKEKFRFILENSHDVIYLANLSKKSFEYVSPSIKEVLGYTPEEMKAFEFNELISFIHPDDQKRSKEHFNILNAQSPDEIHSSIELRMKHKILGYRWMSNSRRVMFDENKKPAAVIGNVIDIDKRKQAELDLQKLHDELERKVKERTRSLEEYNTALRLMLRKEEEVKVELEDKILFNVKELILPYVEKLRMSPLAVRQRKCIDILESNINEIVSPFLHSLSSRFLNLSPGEIQVANFIKHGKSTKEIAELLNLSIRTIEFHRANIRKKVGIKNKKANLRSYLLSIG